MSQVEYTFGDFHSSYHEDDIGYVDVEVKVIFNADAGKAEKAKAVELLKSVVKEVKGTFA